MAHRLSAFAGAMNHYPRLSRDVLATPEDTDLERQQLARLQC